MLPHTSDVCYEGFFVTLTVATYVVFGCRLTVALLTNLPVMALLLIFLVDMTKEVKW